MSHSLYHLEHKSRKWCVRIFYWILSSAVINGWARHCKKHRNFTAICWCGTFSERRSFCIVLGESPKTMQKLCLSTNFPHRKLGEITVFFVVRCKRDYNLLDHGNSLFSKKPENLTLFNWTQKLATALIENVKPTPKPKTGQPFTEPTNNVCFSPKNSRKSHYLVEVSDYIQFDNFEHWPIHQCERSRCFLCKQKKRILLDNREELFQWFFWG